MRTLCIIALLFLYHVLHSQTLYRYGANNKFGFVDSTGKTVIKPQYDKAGDFCNGLVPVRINGKYGYINKQNKVVIPAKFDYAYEFNTTAAIVVFEENYGLINKKGEYVLKPEYDYINYPSDGMYRLRKNNLYGFCDDAGKYFIAPVYNSVMPFSDGMARVEVANRRCGYIDKTGKMIIPAKYFDISGQFGDGLVPVYDSSGCYYIDKTGKTIIDKRFADGNTFSDGIAFVYDKRGTKGYYINKQGLDIFPGKRFKRSWMFGKGLCGAETDSSYVVIDKKGKILFESKTLQFVGFAGNSGSVGTME